MKTGVIGLGAMGRSMALNLHTAGHLASIWNRTQSRADALAELTGIAAATSPSALATQCDLILISVSADTDLLEIVNALHPGLTRNSIVVDTSTVSSATAKQAAAIVLTAGAQFIDAPVSGGVEGAMHGTLAMMAGGDAGALDRVRGTLRACATRIEHMGPVGSGQATKAVNQIMAAGINQAVTEALAFAQSAGLDLDKVIGIVGSGAAGNWFLDHRGKSMVNDSFDPGFKVALHHKDLLICRTMAAELGAEALPVVEMTLHHYQRLMHEGHGGEDISALFRIKRNNFGNR